ncbi:hypothetical protein EDD16DRAFT_188848 [Pisolithus croceorrhizus]|nr:hypothetical protein EDD16DRAFT_188848 [Pisolithus croceorrhizus]
MPFGRALSLLLFPYTHLRPRPLMDLTVRRIYNGVKLSATLLCGRIRGEIWCTRPRGSFPSQREVVGLPSSKIPGEGVTELFAKMKSFGESIRQFTEARWDRASGWDLILDGKINGSAILLYMSDLPTNCRPGDGPSFPCVPGPTEHWNIHHWIYSRLVFKEVSQPIREV